tara:strand:- start:52 stop:933 length:882 start_codon:yes stop_codon:yes gene_type:complete
MSEFRVDSITSSVSNSGLQIAGITTFTDSSGMILPTGTTYDRVVSQLVLSKTIPTEGLKVFLDGKDPLSNDLNDPEFVWKNVGPDSNIPHGYPGIRDGEVTAEPTRIDGVGFDFAGGTTGEGIEIPVNPSEIFNNGAGTLFAFINPDDITTRQTLISGYGSGDHRWDFEIRTSSDLGGGNHDDTYYNMSVDFVINTWQSFAITLDQKGTNGEERYNTQTHYINGLLDSTHSTTTANRGWYGGTNCVLSLARRSNDKSQFEYDGTFGVFLAYNRVLSASEILTLHNTFKGRYEL